MNIFIPHKKYKIFIIGNLVYCGKIILDERDFIKILDEKTGRSLLLYKNNVLSVEEIGGLEDDS